MTHFLKLPVCTATVITVLCLFAIFFPHTVAQAQVISPHTGAHAITPTAHPNATAHTNASGGGCRSTYSGNGTRYVAYSACSSYLPLKIGADGYVTFGAASPGLWRACRVYLYLYDGNNNYVDGRTFDCLSQAKSNAVDAYFGFSDLTGWGSAYHTDMFVYYYYNPDGRGYYGPRISSPTQYT